MLERKAIVRFFKYSLTGASTLLFDLALLYTLTDFFGWHYLFSATVSFLIATTLNHFLARRFIFSETKKSAPIAYANFLLIGGVGVLLVTGRMYVLVERLGVGYVLARLAVATGTGLWNYFMNVYFNFQVAEERGE